MTRKELIEIIKAKKTFLCVGLDTDINKIPKHLLDTEDPIFEFNKQIIDATIDYAAAYKPNIAFYECYGPKGLVSLEKTINYLNTFSKKVFTIADAKRGDIGNTSAQYAKAFFETMNFDAITVAPYMGEDSVSPFLSYENKWIIILALTSNKGSDDFQLCKISDENGKYLFEVVLERSSKWGNTENTMYVVGATKAEMLAEIRKIVPDHFLLVPGVGAQGGSLQEVAKFGMNKDCGLLINASRSILYASAGFDFVEKAKAEAKSMQAEMEVLLKQFNII
jgi:orotidine-5'-phosphate decarboxylase